MKKQWFKAVALVGAATLMAGSVVGCGGGAKLEREENTINIRAYKGGYGVSFLEKLVENFNEVYKEEGYKANLLTPSTTVNGASVSKEMYSKDDWADVYYTGNMGIDSVVDNVQLGSGGNPVTLVYDIEDSVINKPAIGFDGKEETKTIAEKELVSYNLEATEREGKRYALHNNLTVGGMIVNTAKLAKYGLEIPKTTNQMIDCFNLIRFGDKSRNIEGSNDTNIYPITYLGGENGYSTHFYNAWVAQYEGGDWWDNFWSYSDAEGNDITKQADGYKIYEAEGLELAMAEMYRAYDMSYRATGSATATLSMAHTFIMSDAYGAVFMTDGDWAYNEIIVGNKTKINNLQFMNIPVISALGTKLFGSGTAYAFDDAKCEEVLSYLIDRADERKTVAEAVSLASSEKGWTLQEADVTKVFKARGIFVDRGEGAGTWWICNKTKNREICNLFLRMTASEDAAVMMAQEGHMKSAYSTNFDALGTTGYWKSFADIVGNPYADGVWTLAYGTRNKLNDSGILPASGYLFANALIQENVSAYNEKGELTGLGLGVYADKASKKIALDVTAAKNQLWGTNWNGRND